MKQTKFLSIGIGLLQAMARRAGEANPYEDMTAEVVYEAMLEAQQALLKAGVEQPKKEERALGEARITVVDGQGAGLCAQVKLFPIESGEQFKLGERGRIDMVRLMSGDDGVVCARVPVGTYAVEISLGSEYSVTCAQLTIKDGEACVVTYGIDRIANLSEEGFIAGDLHHHSVYSSPVWGGTDPVVETPAEVCQSMRAMGLSFGALSDHHNVLNHREWERCTDAGFIPLLSKEISTSNGHVLSLGVDQDVIYRIPQKEERTDAYLRAEFVRVTDQIKALGGLAQLNHPRDLSRAISWNPAYYDMIDIFETLEIWNGSNPMAEGTTNAMAGQLWLDLLEAGRYIPATTGSDTHNIRADDYHAFVDELCWVARHITPEQAHGDRRLGCLVRVVRDTLGLLERWAQQNLTSGGVRTYVQVDKEHTPQAIMRALRQGNSFLTNGPILIPRIGGVTPGGRARSAHAQITLLANRPVRELRAYMDKGRMQRVELPQVEPVKGAYDYGFVWSQLTLEDAQWVFFVASDGCTNMAITNPIFLEH